LKHISEEMTYSARSKTALKEIAIKEDQKYQT
jgi:hypothetical protein